LSRSGPTPPRTGRSAALVATGILLSRIAGFVRWLVFARYFRLSEEADAFNQAFRIPNLLQNLFGEGALSASFIPVYSSLIARGDRREADRVAGAVASILALLVAVIVLIGVLATPLLIDLIATGFSGTKRDLAIEIVRILFPGAGLLVLSAWCLGILNSHYKFLLSYTAPVLWNVAMIATLILYGSNALPRLAVILAWGSVVGSAAQFLIQLPVVLRLAPDLKFAVDLASKSVRTVFTNFVPAFISRGVVQLSAFIDSWIASFLPTGAVSGLFNAQVFYTLPVSLFGMSISAAELPAMSGEVGSNPEATEIIRRRLDAGLRQIAFFVLPSAVAFLALGDVIAGMPGGRFTRSDAIYVWGILAGSAVGLMASTLGRLYSSTYYAFRDTRTPLRYAVIRVVLTTILGFVFAFYVPRWLNIAEIWGAAGLTASAGIAGWFEMVLLRRTLNARIGKTGLPPTFVFKLAVAAITAAGIAFLLKLRLPALHPILTAIVVLGVYGVVYLGITAAFRIPEISSVLSRLRIRGISRG
jgi:putative peptidoglycan lipid II flippase